MQGSRFSSFVSHKSFFFGFSLCPSLTPLLLFLDNFYTPLVSEKPEKKITFFYINILIFSTSLRYFFFHVGLDVCVFGIFEMIVVQDVNYYEF